MAHTKSSIIFLIVLFSFTCAQLDKKTTSTTETPIDPTTESTSTPTTPETTTTVPTTATTSGTTTTAGTTTEVPTTVAPPTPRPPTPQPEYKKYSYKEKNQTCVIVQLAVQINFNYTTKDDKPSNVFYNVPTDKTIVKTGSCGNDSQSITVQWGLNSTMTLQFKANITASEFILSEIDLSINVTDEFSDAKADQILELNHINNDFKTPLAMSYHCNKLQTLRFTNTKDGKEIVANATVSHVQLEAFHKQNDDQFATARDCEAIDTPDIVPIAVGCALAGLVVVVLIAYLVGRRRAQARGYLSM